MKIVTYCDSLFELSVLYCHDRQICYLKHDWVMNHDTVKWFSDYKKAKRYFDKSRIDGQFKSNIMAYLATFDPCLFTPIKNTFFFEQENIKELYDKAVKRKDGSSIMLKRRLAEQGLT